MSDTWEMKMFTKEFKNLTEEEIMFLEETNKAPGVLSHDNFSMSDKYKVLSSFYLAKQIEASSKSSDKNAKKMFYLTLVIGLLGTVQLVELILKLLGR